MKEKLPKFLKLGIPLTLGIGLLAGCDKLDAKTQEKFSFGSNPSNPSETNIGKITVDQTPDLLPIINITPTPEATLTKNETDRLELAKLVEKQGPALKIPALEYHEPSFSMGDGINMTPKWFNEQMDYLGQEGYHAVTGEELIAFIDGGLQLPAKSVILTFDLGVDRKTEYDEIVIPALERNHLHAIFFLVTGTATEDCSSEYHCWPKLLEWQQKGLVSYGSHSVNHDSYPSLSNEEIRKDALESKIDLEKHLGVKVDVFAYPFEDIGGEEILESVGYKLAFAGWAGNLNDLTVKPDPSQAFRLNRLLPYLSCEGIYISSRLPQPKNKITFPELIKLNTTPPKEDIEAIISFTDKPANNRWETIPNTDPAQIVPLYITLHWDEQGGAPGGWNAEQTYKFFKLGDVTSYPDPITGMHFNYTSHFATGPDGILQFLRMYEHTVQKSYAAKGFPSDINIEMAGQDFHVIDGETDVPDAELEYTLELVLSLMKQYNIPLENVVGHYEHDTYIKEDGTLWDRSKPDPGETFMNYFRTLLEKRLYADQVLF
jgi:peptidoglycan/xylan/chitin deacetylase (PgdA/CDA1 family)